jgi:long-chain acyl-CoA synthetase
MRKTLEYPSFPVQGLLEESAKDFPNSTYLIFSGKNTTFAEVNDMADKFATALADMGIKKGDKVAIFMPNLPHYPVVFFGALKAGAVNVTCNPIYTEKELAYQLKDSGATTIVVLDHPKFYPTALKAINDTNVNNVIVCKISEFLPKMKAVLGGLLGKIPKSPIPINPEHHVFGDLMKKYKPNPPQFTVNLEDDIGLILYTGGTTGTPKGAMLTHKNFVSNVIQITEEMHPPVKKGENIYIGGLPWYHSYGLTTCMLAAAYHAASVVCIPDPRAGNPPFTEILEAIEKYKATYFHAVPTLYGALLNHPDINKYNLSSINACLSGAAPLPLQVANDFEKITGGNVVEGYGLTETSPVATVNPLDGNKKTGSIGLPIPDTILKIIDIDTGEDIKQGETGEIAIFGPQVMKGYWDRPDETANVITNDGFFKTGDIGHMDEEGFFFITDRKKDMIIVGGYKVYPRDVEEVLFKHPSVSGAAAIGIPDDHSGEKVKGFVVLKSGASVSEDELIDFCRKNLAAYKVPKSIEIRSELPMTAIGKVLRRKLRD